MRNLITTFLLTFSLTALPMNVSSLRNEMFSTQDFAQDSIPGEAIDRKELVETLISLGVEANEAGERVNSFSDAELAQLAKTGTLQSGAGGIYIGTGVLLLAIIIILLFK